MNKYPQTKASTDTHTRFNTISHDHVFLSFDPVLTEILIVGCADGKYYLEGASNLDVVCRIKDVFDPRDTKGTPRFFTSFEAVERRVNVIETYGK